MLHNYEKAKALLTQHKAALLQIADALLSREVLDADQVRRNAAGEPLDELTAAVSSTPSEDGSKRPAKERPSIVPALPPLNKPLTQE